MLRVSFIVCVDMETEGTQMFGVRYMPVWAYTLAAHLRRGLPGVELRLEDTRIKGGETIAEADVFLYSALNQDVPSNLALLRQLRRKFPAAKHALGGPATGSLKMAGRLEEMGEFDAVYIGEGESSITDFVSRLASGVCAKVYESRGRFALSESLPMDFTLLASTCQEYYGGVLEVSRGCPFLCEFCDIRTLPDNNKAHNRPLTVLKEELIQFGRLGVVNVLLACDNFIGDPVWAEGFCDMVLALRKESDFRPRFYTWLTINVVNHPGLLAKMKESGFDMLFIGLESFGANQLLETAKVQNTKFDLPEAVRRIQSHGIVVVAGLIFGFDTDTDETTHEALGGILSSGLISGDPTLLTALAGTPLYRRMQLAGRLRQGKVALGGHKYSTNIRYLRPKERIISDYVEFVRTFNSPDFQLRRYRNFLAGLSKHALGPRGGGYIQVGKLLRLLRGNRRAARLALARLARFASSPSRLWAVMRGLLATLSSPTASFSHFSFWVFNWSNSIVKYHHISPADFDIESIAGPISLETVLPPGYEEERFEPIPEAKIRAQRQSTTRTLRKVFAP